MNDRINILKMDQFNSPMMMKNYPLPLVGGKKKNYDNEGDINIIFEEGCDAPGNLPIPQIIMKCSLNDTINTLIMKYREKTGDFFTPKIFMFENNQLNPFLTIEQSKLYMNCKVMVISQEDGNHWSNI